LRHDFVMIGRASAEPLPIWLSEGLGPVLNPMDTAFAGTTACATIETQKSVETS
jgi:hypothetical protein